MGTRAACTLVWATLLGCGPDVVGGSASGSAGDSSSSTGATGSSTTSSSTAGSSGDPTSSTSVDGTGGSSGACGDENEEDTFPGGEFDVGPPPPACDIFEQDCEPDQHCVPQGFVTRECVPIPLDPLADGEPCEDGGDAPCEEHSWCGLVDTTTGMGTCVPLCAGTRADPLCEEGTICVIDDEDIVAFCQAPCDPFSSDACPPGLSCQATALGFGCLQNGGASRGDGCAQNDTCSAGLTCESDAEVEGCCHGSCCTPICDDAHPCETGVCHLLDPVPGSSGFGFCG